MNKKSPIHRLYMAACDIVDGTRKAFEQAGHDGAELRLPIVMQGTDMRVVIESGPSVAARNALETAHGRATGAPLPDGRGAALREAIRLLIDYSEELRCSEVGASPDDVADSKHRIDACLKTIKLLELMQ